MAGQSAVGRQSDTPVRPGKRLGGMYEGGDITRQAGGRAVKIIEVTVDTAVNTTAYTYSVQGDDDSTRAIAYTSDGSATKTEIRDGLIAAHDADSLAFQRVQAYDSAADRLRIEGREAGDDFTFTESDANLSNSVIQSASSGQDIPFGRLVCESTIAAVAELPSRSGGGSLVRPAIGIALIGAKEAKLPGQTEEEHPAGTSFPIRRRGEAAAEVIPGLNPAVGDNVFVYTSNVGDYKISMLSNVADPTDPANTVQLTGGISWTVGPRGKWGSRQVASVYIDGVITS